MKMNIKTVDLSKLLKYFDDLYNIIDKIYPKKLSWENLSECPMDLGIKHPKWVQAHFPMVMIYYRDKAGKLRDSKNIDIMYQNNQNVLTQLVCNADAFGITHRKNKHKAFTNIVGAITYNEDVSNLYGDQQKPKKFKNFKELAQVSYTGDKVVESFCDILEENYPCDSLGQLRLL